MIRLLNPDRSKGYGVVAHRSRILSEEVAIGKELPMPGLVLSSALGGDVSELLSGRARPTARNIFSLSLFLEALILGHDLLLEVNAIEDRSLFLEPLADALTGEVSYYEGHPYRTAKLILQDRHLTRDELIEKGEHFLRHGLRRENWGHHSAVFFWVKHYFFQAFEDGHSIVPDAAQYPADLSVKSVIHSPARVAKNILNNMQRMRQEEIDAARLILGQKSTRLSVPYLLRFVLHQSASPDEVLKTAVNLRYQRSVRRFREWAYGLEMTLQEFGDLADEEYESVLRAMSADMSGDLDFKPELMNIIQSISIPAALATGVIGAPSLSGTKLLSIIGDYIGKRKISPHLAFSRALAKGLKSSKDVSSLVNKLWGVAWEADQVAEFQELASMGYGWQQALGRDAKAQRKEEKIDSISGISSVVKELVYHYNRSKTDVYDALVKSSSLDEFKERLSIEEYWLTMEFAVAQDLNKARRGLRLKTPLTWRRRDNSEVLEIFKKKGLL